MINDQGFYSQRIYVPFITLFSFVLNVNIVSQHFLIVQREKSDICQCVKDFLIRFMS